MKGDLIYLGNLICKDSLQWIQFPWIFMLPSTLRVCLCVGVCTATPAPSKAYMDVIVIYKNDDEMMLSQNA